jgi:paraquat-inducible protein B
VALHQYVEKAVKEGLRVKLVLQDLSGNAFLELNFTNPKNNPILPISWKPKYAYIPSTKSSLTRFSDSVEKLLDNLKKADFAKMTKSLNELAITTNKTMTHVNKIVAGSQASMVRTADNMAVVSENLRGLTNQLKENPSSILFDKPPHVDPANL